MITLDPARTAVLVVDMQNDFCHPEGFYGRSPRDLSEIFAVVPGVEALVARAREAGAGVIFTQLVAEVGMETRHRRPPKRFTASGEERLRPGSWGAAMLESLTPRDGEPVIVKRGYSAFHDTDLAGLLTERGIDTLILSGVTTYACVLASGFAAFDHGLDVLLASDATASWDGALTRATGDIVDYLLGHSVTIDEIAFAPANTSLETQE